MSAPPPSCQGAGHTLLLVWAIAASAAALVATGVALWAYREAGEARGAVQPIAPQTAFANMAENTIPGRYKWIEEGQDMGVVILRPDGSVVNWRGEGKPGYSWRLQSEGLLLVWLGSYNLFTRVAGPGVYEGSKSGKATRMEKME